MQAVILAGGMGTRIAEESHLRPKPMIEIGGRPIIWHIMKIYSHYGIKDFVICLGYRGYQLKEYFASYRLHSSNVTIQTGEGTVEYEASKIEDWTIKLIDTGEQTMTGGRLKRVAKYLDETFCMTYGDGVADIDIGQLIRFHRLHRCLATVSAVQPPGRFGAIDLDGERVRRFLEKPAGDGGWINGGFFVLSRRCLDLIEDDASVWEDKPMRILAGRNEMMAYRHRGFWQSMDTLRDKNLLSGLWDGGAAPWKVWT